MTEKEQYTAVLNQAKGIIAKLKEKQAFLQKRIEILKSEKNKATNPLRLNHYELSINVAESELLKTQLDIVSKINTLKEYTERCNNA